MSNLITTSVAERNKDQFVSNSDAGVLKGTFPVVPTPFDGKGGVDWRGLERSAQYILEAGADGLVFPGLASEYAQLTEEERFEATRLIGNLCKDRVPFIVGAGASMPDAAIRFARAGAEAGAQCAMVMAPNHYADDPEAMRAFFDAVAEAAGIPIMLQNAPAPMGAGLPVEQIASILSANPAIEYVKEETMPCGQRMEAILAIAPATLKGVFGGAGGRYILDELSRGALGTVPASELTEVHVALVSAWQRGEQEKARELFINMLPILNMQAIFRCNLTKWVLTQRGILNTCEVRVPGPTMDEGDRQELRAFWPRVADIMGKLESRQSTPTPEEVVLP
ncbi:dihydrodipicolinate synthase family protein [Microbulbifer elongatus]|uniref:Dihydrodipicolinate synthase family protein n=1 Tax=Microbulbifer elongatus TaxID=86173 RepID=A0ABT1P253_9GAMM|nr:dihydrodipicolinate synthase family protein [Microbulbifer elongatus]MCQ3830201.1 dihydrodipicolinate synthase family protein [Microbulbifer elongatus]